MESITMLAGRKPAPRRIAFLPGSKHVDLVVSVKFGREYHDLIARGAPQTDSATIKAFEGIAETFVKHNDNVRKVKIMLVSFPGFIMDRKVDRWIVEQKLVPMDLHTMLTLSEDCPTLARTMRRDRIRLVSLANAFDYLGERRVCTVHQENYSDIVRRVMTYECVRGGWSHEHVFGFVI